MPLITDPTESSLALVRLALLVRSGFRPNKLGVAPDKVIVKAREVGLIYFQCKETLTTHEIEVLLEILREFGIVSAHVPPEFHTHVANVVKAIELKQEAQQSISHVAGLIFTRI